VRQIFDGFAHHEDRPRISSLRGRPNRKWPTHARWFLRRRWCSVGARSVPRVGQAFGIGAGSRGLAGPQAIKRAAAPTGIVHAFGCKKDTAICRFGRKPECDRSSRILLLRAARRGVHGSFPHLHSWRGALLWNLGHRLRGRAGELTSQPDPVHASNRFLDRDYSLLNRSLCKFGILSKDLQ